MKMELLICDIDKHKQDCEFTVWNSLRGEVKPETKLSHVYKEMMLLLNVLYIRGKLNKYVCVQIEGEIVPASYVKSDMTVEEAYDKVRDE